MNRVHPHLRTNEDSSDGNAVLVVWPVKSRVKDGRGGGTEGCWRMVTLLHLLPSGESGRQPLEVNTEPGGSATTRSGNTAAGGRPAAPALQITEEAGARGAESPLQTQWVSLPHYCSHTRSHVA